VLIHPLESDMSDSYRHINTYTPIPFSWSV
jgi:hypothetical protein